MAFDQFDADESITSINVTPLVDITLVLLIIFMVTTTYIVNPSIKVDLPRAATGEKSKPTPLSVVLTEGGELYLNGAVLERTELMKRVREEVATDPEVQVVISADTVLQYGRVVWLLDLMKQLGVRRYALNIKHEAED